MRAHKKNRDKIVTGIVFGVYLFLLIWLVLFKFATGIEQIPRLRGINLVPFHYEQENAVHLREILLNVLVCIPAGFYFSVLFAKTHIFLGTAATAALSLSFEAIQWVFSIGASDVTDLITNTLGGCCGMLLFLLLAQVAPNYGVRIINALGIIIEVLGIVLLTILLASNS